MNFLVKIVFAKYSYRFIIPYDVLLRNKSIEWRRRRGNVRKKITYEEQTAYLF